MTVFETVEQKPAVSLAALLLAPFRALGHMLIVMAESGPQAKAINRLNRMSDAELAVKGLTREGEVRRIMGAY